MPIDADAARRQNLAQQFLDEIVGCESCQPWDKERNDYFWVHGDRTSIEELLEEAGIPEPSWGLVASNTNCGQCGAAIELDTDVGLSPEASAVSSHPVRHRVACLRGIRVAGK